MSNQKISLILFAFLASAITQVVLGQTRTTPVPFTFTLQQEATTSAGVFTSDGKLIRTLWSGITYSAGQQIGAWDLKDDDGNYKYDPSYVVKVLSNNVKYNWEGVLGNTSEEQTGSSQYRSLQSIEDLVVVGGTAYYCVNYNEISSSILAFKTSNPQQRLMPFARGGNSRIACADNSTVYFGMQDANNWNNTYVIGVNASDNSYKNFTNGVTYDGAIGITYNKVISLNKERKGITGMAVQKNGDFLFVARSSAGKIDVFNKNTGLFVRTIVMTTPKKMACDNSNGIWIISATNTIAKYTIETDGSLSSAVVILQGIVQPLAVTVSPDNTTVVVNDGGTSQQLKGFNNSTGTIKWTRGTLGGYTKGATVTNNKFYFDDQYDKWSINTYTAFQSDGSYWVGDVGNNRIQHYTSTGTFIETVMYRPKSYSCRVDANNPTRVFSDYLEYKVDYSKSLQEGWTLAKNWGAFIPKFYEHQYQKLTGLATLPNGRTYATMSNETASTQTERKVILLELTGDVIRNTGVSWFYPNSNFNQQLYPDGSLRRITRHTVGAPTQIYQRDLHGFDGLNNPIWGPEVLKITTPAATGLTPGYHGNTTLLRSGERTTSGKWVVFDYTGTGKGYHLGLVKEGQKAWSALTAKATFEAYKGEYPTDGAFDIGNGVNNAGSVALAYGDNVFWGYTGEFWKNSQTNKWTQVWENGLMVGVFGWAGKKLGSDYASAGNSFSAHIVKHPNDPSIAYIYQNDEAHHGGVHRWKISNLNSIDLQTAVIDLEGEVPALEGIDLMAGLPGRVVLQDGTEGWNRQTTGEETADYYSKFWSVKTGVKSYNNTDVYIKYRQQLGKYSVTRDLGTNTNLASWKLSGVISWEDNAPNHVGGGSYIEVLDNQGKIITRVFTQGIATTSIYGNSTVIAQGERYALKEITDLPQQLSISVNSNGATISYARYPAVTAPIFDPTANWKAPKTMRLFFWTNSSLYNYHRIIDIETMRFAVKNVNSSVTAPTITADDSLNTLIAAHSLGSSEILVSENNDSFIPDTGKIIVGNVARPVGYWKFKIKSATGRNESVIVESPAFTITNSTSTTPVLSYDDVSNTISASHDLGISEILVSVNNGTFTTYSETINVGNVARSAGYWKFKIKSATGRNESAVVESPAFTITNSTSTAPVLSSDDVSNTISASHDLGISEILVSVNNGTYTAYTGTITVGNIARHAGYWKFKIKAATGRNESPVVESPEFTIFNSTPTPPVLSADDELNTLNASHNLDNNEILMSVDNGAFSSYTGTINIGNIARPEGYWKFKIKAATGRNESAVVESPEFTIFNSTPTTPIISNDDQLNTLSASHDLGSSEILISVNDETFTTYNGTINVGNTAKPAGYWKFKIKAAAGRNESPVAESPAFTITELAPVLNPNTIPASPSIDANDNLNVLHATHELGTSEILVSENDGPFVDYINEINVGNEMRPSGYWKFKVKGAPGRAESAISLSSPFTQVTTPAPPVLSAKDVTNTLSASHSLGISQILVSENNGQFIQYTGYLKVGNVTRPAAYWKFKIKAANGRSESEVVESPAFRFTPAAPKLIVSDESNTIAASHELGTSEILISINNEPYKSYLKISKVGNVIRAAGYYRYKIRAAAGRTESAVATSPAFTYTPVPPTLTAKDSTINTLSAYHSSGSSNILVSENLGSYVPYTGRINVGNVARPSGYWKFKVKAAEGRSESAVVNSAPFTSNNIPDAPSLVADDVENTLIASHSLGISEILVSINGQPYGQYTSRITVGRNVRPAGYFKFKTKATSTRKESLVAQSPAFTVPYTPSVPVIAQDDWTNEVSASHELGNSEIIVSVNDGPYVQYTGPINVGNVKRSGGYVKFRIKKLIPTRTESGVAATHFFTYTATPNAPTITADNKYNTLSASHVLGNSNILVSVNNGTYVTYTGRINVGNVSRPAGYWKFKTSEKIPTRFESSIAESPAFTVSSVAKNVNDTLVVESPALNITSAKTESTVLQKTFETKLTKEMKVFPNPLRGNNMNIQFSNIKEGKYVLTLIASNGQVVLNKIFNYSPISSIATINVTPILKGIYLLHVSGPDTVETKTIIKE